MLQRVRKLKGGHCAYQLAGQSSVLNPTYLPTLVHHLWIDIDL